MPWDHRKYATVIDPLRQSDLGNLASQYACSKRFAYEKNAEADGLAVSRRFASWKACVGTGVHETVKAYLTRAENRILRGELPTAEAVLKIVRVEVEKAAEGLSIEWRDAKPEDELEDASLMVLGALRLVARLASKVLLVEASFRVDIHAPGDKATYAAMGTVDLVYVPKSNPDGIGLLDWKTGSERPERVILDHGYQLGIYSLALAEGVFFPGEERETRIGQFPSEIGIAHLRDAVPYQKAGSKKATRIEDADFFGVALGATVKYVAGDARGPVLYPSRRSVNDMGRLRASVHALVGTVRLGRFVEYLGDGCLKCAHATKCLAEGNELAKPERDALEDALVGVDKKHLNVLSDFAA